MKSKDVYSKVRNKETLHFILLLFNNLKNLYSTLYITFSLIWYVFNCSILFISNSIYSYIFRSVSEVNLNEKNEVYQDSFYDLSALSIDGKDIEIPADIKNIYFKYCWNYRKCRYLYKYG